MTHSRIAPSQHADEDFCSWSSSDLSEQRVLGATFAMSNVAFWNESLVLPSSKSTLLRPVRGRLQSVRIRQLQPIASATFN